MIKLRRPLPADLAALHSLDNDPDVMRWLNGGLPIDLETFRVEFLPNFFSAHSDPFGYWVVEEGDSGLVGWVSLIVETQDAESGDSLVGTASARLGYRLVKNWWGRGIATHACELLIDKLADVSKLKSLRANTYQENLASQRVLEKLGFRLVRRYRPTQEQLSEQPTAISSGEVWAGDEFEYELTL